MGPMAPKVSHSGSSECAVLGLVSAPNPVPLPFCRPTSSRVEKSCCALILNSLSSCIYLFILLAFFFLRDYFISICDYLLFFMC